MNRSIGYVSSIGDTTAASLQAVWYTVVGYLPRVVSAIIILIIGLILASVISKLIAKAVHALRADEAIDRTGLNERLNVSRKYRLLSGFLGQCVKWFIIIATLIAVANSLNLPQITEFLNQVALYIPRVIAAIVILVAGMLLADFIKNFLTRAMQASRLPVHHKNLIGSVAKSAIIVFTVMAVLVQLNIVPELVEILFAGLVLALALAFGLGGREEASRLLASLRTDR